NPLYLIWLVPAEGSADIYSNSFFCVATFHLWNVVFNFYTEGNCCEIIKSMFTSVKGIMGCKFQSSFCKRDWDRGIKFGEIQALCFTRFLLFILLRKNS